MIRYSLDFFQRFAEHTDGALLRLPPHRLPARRRRADAPAHGEPRSRSSARSASTRGSSRPPTCARSSRACARRPGGRLLRAASGYCDPVETAQGFARGRARRRARASWRTPRWSACSSAGDRVRGVRTTAGDIHAPVVVNAAGLWSAPVGRDGRRRPARSTCAATRSASWRWPEADRRPHPMVYDFVTNIYTRPEMGEHILVGGARRRGVAGRRRSRRVPRRREPRRDRPRRSRA